MVGESKGMKSRIQTKLEPLNYFFGILSNPEKPPTIEVQIGKNRCRQVKCKTQLHPMLAESVRKHLVIGVPSDHIFHVPGPLEFLELRAR